MVNIEEFGSRLKIILNYYEISAAQLAEKIDVQRSSISHILSGRNKPSLEFVLKMLKAFPEVELYWLLNGKGKFPNIVQNELTPSPLSTDTGAVTQKISETNKVKSSDRVTNEAIERIVIFYKDGTFKNYIP
jgi:transcriptional regulator with XRE-family HTH domain